MLPVPLVHGLRVIAGERHVQLGMLGHHSHMLHGPALVGDGQRARRQLRRIQAPHICPVAIGIDDHAAGKRRKGRVRPGPGVHRQIGADAGLARGQGHGIDRRAAAVIGGIAFPVVGQIVQIAAIQGGHGGRSARGRIIDGHLRHGCFHVFRARHRLYQRQILSILVGAQRTQRAVHPLLCDQLAGIQRVALYKQAAFSLTIVLSQAHHFAVLHEHGIDIAAVINAVFGRLFLHGLQRAQGLNCRAARAVHQPHHLTAALVEAVEAFAVGQQAGDHRRGGIRAFIPVAAQPFQHGFRLVHSGAPAFQPDLPIVRAAIQVAHKQVQVCAHNLSGPDRPCIGIGIIGHDMKVDIHGLGQRR